MGYGKALGNKLGAVLGGGKVGCKVWGKGLGSVCGVMFRVRCGCGVGKVWGKFVGLVLVRAMCMCHV